MSDRIVTSVEAARRLSALQAVVRLVARTGYRFVTTTPVTHERKVVHSGGRPGTTLRDVFGWNLPFAKESLGPAFLETMARAGILRQSNGEDLWTSSVRLATIGDDIFLHSAYPTTHLSAVFFGPDTYRFVRFVRRGLIDWLALPRTTTTARVRPPLRVLDIGCGSGAGGIVAARVLARAGVSSKVTLNDINPDALTFARINAAVAGIPVDLVPGDALSAVEGKFDLIISNPPYLDDDSRRAYRHGGGKLGCELGLRIAAEALQRLAPGGLLLMYTGVAMVEGHDAFLSEISPALANAGCRWSYEEIDPDVFGEELDRLVYSRADRIAVVGLSALRGNPPA